jgi:head-tail adaptor
MKNILLPIAAVLVALFGISYSGCQESKADTKSTGTAGKIREEIVQYEQMYNELKKVQEANVTAYSEEMGVTSNSTALEQINKQNEIMENLRLRLEYHRLQLIQADTTNETRNELQLKEISEDIVKLKADGEIIRSGLGETVNTRVTK